MELKLLMRDAGLVGAGGAGFPSYAKLAGGADTLLINGAECEPLLYPSIRAAANANNIKATNIGAVCAKKPHYLTAGGYKWAYAEEVVIE